MDLLLELFILLRSRRKLWLRPIIIVLLIIAGLLLLIGSIYGWSFGGYLTGLAVMRPSI